MDLEKLSVAVRPRSNWQAMDMGFLMARQWYGPMLRIWLLCSLPWFLLGQYLFHDHLMLFALWIWWFKPLWEAPQLYFLSRALFGETLSARQLLQQWSNWLHWDLFWWLTLRRFSLSRSLTLPVSQLEQLRGQARQQRLRVLRGKYSTGIRWLTLSSWMIELLLASAVFSLVLLLLPQQLHWDWHWLAKIFYGDSALVGNSTLYLALMLVAPCYVAAGFSLYIHQRIWLEGWDLELIFRRLAKRLSTTISGLLLGCLLLIGLSPANSAWANQAQQTKQEIKQIVAHEPFQRYEQDWAIVGWEDWFKPSTDTEADMPTWLKQLEQFFRDSSAWLRLLFWALVLGLILIFLFRYRHWLQSFFVEEDSQQTSEAPKQLFGLALSRDSLPADIIAEAQKLWQQSEQRSALALLYRAALSHLVTQSNLRLLDSDTEGRCVQQVKKLRPGECAHYFEQLTYYWVQSAYRHQPPDPAMFQQLCQQWPLHFKTAH